MDDLTALLHGAEPVLAAAAAKLVALQHGPLRTERKDLLDVVTEADLAAEEIVVQGLTRLTPNAAILAEERGATAGRSGVTRVSVKTAEGRDVAEFTGYSRTIGGAVVEL